MSEIVDKKPEAVFDWFKRPKDVLEMNSGEEVVEKEGYIPADVQISTMIKAGIRLGEYRREAYDYADESDVPDDAMDPRSFTDPVDATRALDMVNNRIKKDIEKSKEAESKEEKDPPKAE